MKNICAITGATEDIRPLVELNKKKVHEIAEHIIEICEVPMQFETLLQRLFSDYQLTMTFEQYVLIGSTLRSYLSWLKDSGRMIGYIENNMLLWKRTT